MNVKDAYCTAGELLSLALPRRWAHTKAVAAAAERLARVIAPRHTDDIVAAAWLHDIGYSPELVVTGFHPIDGARYAIGAGFPSNIASLIAHHTGAVIEARERGLSDQLAVFEFPVDEAELAILSCADLCTGPDGAPVDPGERIAEVLQRYPADDPVHRAISTSGPVLVDQARLVLAAAETANCVANSNLNDAHIEMQTLTRSLEAQRANVNWERRRNVTHLIPTDQSVTPGGEPA